MAQDPDITRPPDNAESVQATKPNAIPPGLDTTDPYNGPQYEPPLDKKYWLQCLSDAERAEADFRKRGREIIEIYRNEGRNSRGNKQQLGVTFNILYANTEVMIPAVYQKPPKPVVRSRFAQVQPPPPVSLGPPPMPPGMGMGPPPPGAPEAPPALPPGGGLPMGPEGVPSPPMPVPQGGAPAAPPAPINGPAPIAGPAVPGGPGVGAPPGPPMPPAMLPGGIAPAEAGVAPGGGMSTPPPGAPPGLPPTLGPPPSGPPKPDPADIETAASVMQKALEVVLDDDNSNEAIRLAIKDVLLPGRGVCRVRWKPQMQQVPLPGGPLPDGTTPTEERKVWEEVADEYVFWEDLLVDPVRAAPDTDWIAFRHLFTKEALDATFAGSPEYEKLKAVGKVESILRWTDESAAKNPVGGGAALKTSRHLGDYVRKAMVWEIWHRPTKRVIWFIRETGGLMLRIDPDIYALIGFYPIPMPMLAVVTSDSRIPRPYYDLYAKLANDLDETSARISALTKHIKARGAYNSASRDIADLLTAGDNKMIPVDGVDMLNGGLQNHIWMVPIEIFVQALTQLYIARDQIKNAIYEVMGISDIMRGATKATETATAQRIKGSMGVSRLEDQKQSASNFVRDLLRLKAELICQNFEPETLEAMTGETVTPEVLAILRSDFQRSCLIDIESDSTVIPDLQAEQQGMAMVMQSVQLVMQGTQQMLMTQILPPPQVLQLGLELLKMALHPVPYSRGTVELINNFSKQLQMMPPMPFPMPPPPAALPPPGAGEGPPKKNGGPPGGDTARPPPVPQGMPPGMAPPPGLQ